MAAKIIAVANQKGGVGKTTDSINLTDGFHRRGLKSILMDIDPQNTAVHWSAASGEEESGIPYPVANLAAAGKNVHREIKKYINDYDVIVVDCPPSLEDPRTAVALLVCDVVVIPTSSAPADHWSSTEFLRMIEQTQVRNPDLLPFWLFTKVVKNRLLMGIAEDAVRQSGIPVLKTSIQLREAHPQSQALGIPISQLRNKTSKAAVAEFDLLVKEILSAIAERDRANAVG